MLSVVLLVGRLVPRNLLRDLQSNEYPHCRMYQATAVRHPCLTGLVFYFRPLPQDLRVLGVRSRKLYHILRCLCESGTEE